MKKWIIEYYYDSSGKSSVERWLDDLTKDQFKSIAKELKLLEVCGNELKLPHSRSLGKGLFELRERRFGYRIYYGFLDNQIILGDKSTQKNDINIARERLSKFKEV